MDKKLIGIITSLISMVSVAIFLVWGFCFNGWEICWIVFIFSGISVAAVSMIGNYTREKKENKDE